MKLSSLFATLILSASTAFAGGHDWQESPFGPTDQAGRSNLMTPEKALQATALMKTGTVLSLGRTYEAAIRRAQPYRDLREWAQQFLQRPTLG